MSVHRFSELHLLGGGQLAVMPVTDTWNAVEVKIGRLYGDTSGTLHVGYNQSFEVEVTDPDVPFNLRVYERGAVDLPRRAFLHHVSFHSSGKVLYLILFPSSRRCPTAFLFQLSDRSFYFSTMISSVLRTCIISILKLLVCSAKFPTTCNFRINRTYLSL